jgi:hypothetical protein
LGKVSLEAGTRYAILTTQAAPKPDKKTGEMPTQQEQDRWERIIPVMNELLEAKGLKKVAEGAILVTGVKGSLEDSWQDKVAIFADQIMSSMHSQAASDGGCLRQLPLPAAKTGLRCHRR